MSQRIDTLDSSVSDTCTVTDIQTPELSEVGQPFGFLCIKGS